MKVKSKEISDFIIYILCFFYIFNIRIMDKPYTDSSYIVLLYCVFIWIANNKFRKFYKKILLSKYHICLIFIYILVIIMSLLAPAIQNTGDYSFVMIIIHQVVVIEIGVLLFTYINLKNKNANIKNILIKCFIAQASIQLISFISPTFKQITDIFRTQNIILKAEMSYLGYRGLAISSSAFFALATGYAIIYYTLIYYWKEFKCKNIVIKWLSLVLLIFGGLSAGRVSIVGLIIGIIMNILKIFLRILYEKKIKISMFIIPIVVIVAIFVGNKLIPKTSNQSLLRMYNYVNSMIVGIFSDEGLTATSSGEHLFKDMYFKLSAKQFILGDGKYTVDNSYYMKTDAGYMRVLLFFGIFGLLGLFILQIYLLKYIYKKDKTYTIGLIILILILQIKGEVLGFLIISQEICFLINSSFIKLTEKTNY